MAERILHITGGFDQGGSERQAVDVAAGLRREGSFDVLLATLRDSGPLRAVAEEAGLIDIPAFPLTSFLAPSFLAQAWRCARFIRRNEVRIVHTHDFYTNLFGATAATLAGVPVRIASKRETNGMRSRGQTAAERAAFAGASAIVANSAAVKSHLIGYGISPDKIRVVHNGVDIDRFGSARPSPGNIDLTEGDVVVTLVANLRHEVKNVPMLLRAAKRVLDGGHPARFVIAGEGELQPFLEADAQRLGIDDRVHFIGRCSDVPGLLAASDICVLTSLAEGFSNSILEYMAAGKPVVATRVGGAAEAIVDGHNGFLVRSDDDVALAVRLSELIVDGAKRARFGEAGRIIVRDKFTVERQLNSLMELYRECLAENNAVRMLANSY